MTGTTGLLLNTPTTVAMDDQEQYLYVSDMANNRIQKFHIVWTENNGNRLFNSVTSAHILFLADND
jgi:sugar lactone lactonase YvrE